MTFCTGCNTTLGWKKYNFQKQWRIQGYFCKACMIKIGKDFDDNGRITIPKISCDSCKLDFYFLNTTWQNNQHHKCCNICKDIPFSDLPKTVLLPNPSSRIPLLMAVFAVFGVLLMVIGLVYVLLVAPQQDSNFLHIIVGSCMTAGGFMLARKMVKVRNLILRKTLNSQQQRN